MTTYLISFTNRYGFCITITCYSRATAAIQARHVRLAGYDPEIRAQKYEVAP